MGASVLTHGAVSVLTANPLGQKQRSDEDTDGLVAISGILK